MPAAGAQGLKGSIGELDETEAPQARSKSQEQPSHDFPGKGPAMANIAGYAAAIPVSGPAGWETTEYCWCLWLASRQHGISSSCERACHIAVMSRITTAAQDRGAARENATTASAACVATRAKRE